MSRDTKLISAITLAIIKKWISAQDAHYYEANRNELYALIESKGWLYNHERNIWKERKIFNRKPPQVKVMQSPVPTTVRAKDEVLALLRIIAPASELDYILAQMNELIPCLDGEIVSTSKEYPGNGSWNRVYLKIRFSRSIDNGNR